MRFAYLGIDLGMSLCFMVEAVLRLPKSFPNEWICPFICLVIQFSKNSTLLGPVCGVWGVMVQWRAAQGSHDF
jgi:hypothetical protein